MDQTWEIDSIQINSITVLKTAMAAELFLEKVYPEWTDTIVASADGVYPKDQRLNALIFNHLKTHTTVPVVVFGVNSIKRLGIISQNILKMDEFLTADFYRFSPTEKIFNWTDTMIAGFLNIWVRQLSNGRENNADTRPFFDPKSIQWYHNILFE
jgi:hypothetical protein